MRILAITFDVELSGGANRSFLMVISALINQYRHDIRVVIPGHGEIEEELQTRNIPYDTLYLPQAGVVLKSELKDILRKGKANQRAFQHYLKAISTCWKYRKYDIVYINGTSQLCGYYIAKLLRKRFVWHFRGYLTNKHYYCINQSKIFNDLNGKIIVISNSMYQKLSDTMGIKQERMIMIHNGLDGNMGEKHDILVREEIHCVLCGRLIRIKGQLDAIEAFHLLNEQGINNLYLHLPGNLQTGNKQYIELLRETIGKYNLKNRVVFEGQVDDMMAFRQNMDIELMCSVDEPFGRVTVEGMRSGLLVIAANTGGSLDIIQDGYNGLFYTQGNAHDLADKIHYAIVYPEVAQTIANNAYEFSKTHFTVDQNVRHINTVIEGINQN